MTDLRTLQGSTTFLGHVGRPIPVLWEGKPGQPQREPVNNLASTKRGQTGSLCPTQEPFTRLPQMSAGQLLLRNSKEVALCK